MALVTSLFVIIVPLPPAVMDILLVANIALSVLVLLTTVFVQTPLEFSIFPTVLLGTTLARLVLNIATTRLILTRGSTQGIQAAGDVINRFSEFVAGSEIVVGMIIFGILVAVQFLVITKGATRISEVAARFALDGMPGKQMAIDADLNAGLIDQSEAHRRREEVGRQADFYGAMDGASKFVRGDAVAGILITAINVVGGLYLGVVQEGMGLAEAASVYTRLTIGDGLVSQLPAFLVALAAGLLITRSSERQNLPHVVLRQLLSRPEPLFVAAGFLSLLVFTRLPAVPLIVVGTGFAGIALVLVRAEQVVEAVPQPVAARAGTPTPEGSVEEFLSIDPLELEIGGGLLPLADPKRGGDLLERIGRLRNLFAADLGIVLPRVRIRDNLRLPDRGYRFKMFGNVMATGNCFPQRLLAMPPGEIPAELAGATDVDPCTGRPCLWIDAGQAERAAQLGCELLTPLETLVGHLRAVIRQHASRLLTRDATRRLIERARENAPAVVEELLVAVKVGDVQRVLQALAEEQVSIRNLPLILETLCDRDARHTTHDVVEFVRERLGEDIISRYRNRAGKLRVLALTPTAAELVQRGLAETADDPNGPDDPRIAAVVDAIGLQFQPWQTTASPPVLLVPPPLRAGLRRRTQRWLPNLAVLSTAEIPPHTEIESIGVVELDASSPFGSPG